MLAAIPPFPHTSLCRGALLSTVEILTLLHTYVYISRLPNEIHVRLSPPPPMLQAYVPRI
jgi:hypothetical protein